MAVATRGALAAVTSLSAAPVSVVAGLQPYTTVEAPAITAQFHQDPDRFPFQRVPLRVAGSQRLYQAATVERFLSMLHEPRLGTNQQSFTELAPHVVPKLSSLTTEYTTVYQPQTDHPPAWGSVELVPAAADANGSNVGYCGLSVSLWDNVHNVISTSLLTGTPSGSELAVNAGAFIDLLRKPLPRVQHDVQEHLRDGGQGTYFGFQVSGRDAVRGREEPVLVGDLASTGKSSWSQHVAFPVEGGEAMEKEGSRDPETGLPNITLTGWAFDVALLRVVTRLVAATAHGQLAMPERIGYLSGTTWTPALINSMRTPPIVLASRNITLMPLDMTRPINFVMATPKLWHNYQASPWEQKIGSPALNGVPMLAVKFRVFQEGILCGEGTAAYTEWRDPSKGKLR